MHLLDFHSSTFVFLTAREVGNLHHGRAAADVVSNINSSPWPAGSCLDVAASVQPTQAVLDVSVEYYITLHPLRTVSAVSDFASEIAACTRHRYCQVSQVRAIYGSKVHWLK